MLSFRGVFASYQQFIRARVKGCAFQNLDDLPRRQNKINAVTFWKVNLFAILLGFRDLVPSNIPITRRGNIVFFDNEDIFPPHNSVQVFTNPNQSFSFHLPIVNLMVEWPQANSPLSSQDAKILNAFLKKWKEVDLDAYLTHSLTKLKLTKYETLALKERFLKLGEFYPLKEGQTFSALFFSLYPELENGKDTLTPIVESITKVFLNASYSHYSSLVFMGECRKWWEGLTDEDNKKMLLWVEKYYGNLQQSKP